MDDTSTYSDRSLGGASLGNDGEGGLFAGVAKRDISTEDPETVVHDSLFAKALVLRDGQTTAAIVSMDAVAIGGICDITDDFLPALRSRIEDELGIPGANVLVHATHTHPPGRILCDDDALLDRAVDAVAQASRAMIPVKTGFGRTREERIIINRSLKLKDGGHWTIRHANPCPPDEAVEDVSPIDPEVGVLRIDRLDGRPFAIVYNFACHPLLGVPGSHVTANYPGFASKVIEDVLGDGVMAFFIQGAAGDVVELHFKDVNRPRSSEPIGTILGLTTLKAIKDIRTRPSDLRVTSDTVRLPRRRDMPEHVQALKRRQEELLASLRFCSLNFKAFLPLYLKYALNAEYPSDYSYRYLQAEKIGSDELVELDKFNRRDIDRYLSNMRAMEELTRIQDEIETYHRHEKINDDSGEETVAAEVMGIGIGDCALVSAPIELLTEVGLGIKRMSPARNTMIAAFSNGYLHYGAPVGDYGKGGYEVVECMLDQGWQAIYEKKAMEVLARVAPQPQPA